MPVDIVRYGSLTDTELIDFIVSGDEKALGHLFSIKCGPGFSYLLQKYYYLKIEKDEIVNEVYIVLAQDNWKVLRGFRGENSKGIPCKLENYIIVIASRLFWKKNQKKMSENQWLKPLNDMEDCNIPDTAAEKQKISIEIFNMIMELLDPIERQVIIQYKLEEQPVDIVAVTLNTSPANIYTLYSRAVRKLRAKLKNGGIYV